MAAHEADPKDEFAAAIRRAGLVLPGEPIMDGKLHRVAVVDGKPTARDGAYVGFTDGKPSGFIQNFRAGTKETWSTEGKELSPQERAHMSAQMELAKLQRAADLAVQHESTAAKVVAKWDRLTDVPLSGENAYLVRKGVEAHGVKFNGEQLVVPARDAEGKLWTLQSIAAEPGGAKMFEKGGRKTGHFHLIGEPKPGETILVAEGYATGASLYEASRKPVVVAFDAGNLDPVVASIKQRYPNHPIYVMGDNDHHLPVNQGVEKAIAVANKHHVGVGFPEFQNKAGLSDFNDLQVREGRDVLSTQVEKVLTYSMAQSRDVARASFSPDARSPERELSAPSHTPSVSHISAMQSPPAAEPAPQAAVSSQPRVDLSALSDWVREPIAQQRAVADRLGVTGDIERMAYEQKTAAQIVIALEPKLGEVKRLAQLNQDIERSTPSSAMNEFVRSVRTSMGIPSLDQRDEYAAWRRDFEERSRAQTQAEPSQTQTRTPVAIPIATSTPAPLTVTAVGHALDGATHPRVSGQAVQVDAVLTEAIEHRSAATVGVRQDTISTEEARAWVQADLAAFRQVAADGDRGRAAFAMGTNAQEQLQYKIELAGQDPQVSNLASSAFMEQSARRIATEVPGQAAASNETALELTRSRHAAAAAAGGLEGFAPEKVATVAREDVLALRQLRGTPGEAAAYVAIERAMQTESYRAEFNRESGLLPLASPSPQRQADALARHTSVSAADIIHRDGAVRRSIDLEPLAPTTLGQAAAREMVALDLAALRNTREPALRIDIAEAMGANLKKQTAYQHELTRQDPEVGRALDSHNALLHAGLRHVYENERPHSAAGSGYGSDAVWALPIIVHGTFAAERAHRLTPSTLTADTFVQTLGDLDRPVQRNNQFSIPSTPDLQGDFRASARDPVYALARSRGLLLQDDPIARYITAQPPETRLPTLSAKADPGRPTLNSVEHRPTDQEFDDAGLAAMRKRIAQSSAQQLSASVDGESADRRLEVFGRMTHEELKSFAQAASQSPGEAAKAFSAAEKRLEAEANPGGGRMPHVPLEDRFNPVSHLFRKDYHFREGAHLGQVAFTERWQSMRTTHDSRIVVEGIIDRALEKGWTTIHTRGSPEFQRMAWIAADARGMRSIGHSPTAGDREESLRERARLAMLTPTQQGGTIAPAAARAQAHDATPSDWRDPRDFGVPQQGLSPAPKHDNLPSQPTQGSSAAITAMVGAPAQPAPHQTQGVREQSVAQPLRAYLTGLGDTPANVEAVVAVASAQVKSERVYVGLVNERGYAPYEFNKDNKESPYVKLQGPQGESVVWGVDLPRAMDAGKIREGDSIVLEYRGHRAVEVPVVKRDDQGNVLSESVQVVNRNEWFAAKLSDLRAQALPEQRPAVAANDPSSSAAYQAKPATPTTPASPVAAVQPSAHASSVSPGQSQAAAAPAPAHAPAPEPSKAQTTPVPSQAGAVAPAPKPTPTMGEDEKRVMQAFEAAMKQKSVPESIQSSLRDAFRNEYAARQARGESVSVNVFDPAAKREVRITPTTAVDQKPKRTDHKISL